MRQGRTTAAWKWSVLHFRVDGRHKRGRRPPGATSSYRSLTEVSWGTTVCGPAW